MAEFKCKVCGAVDRGDGEPEQSYTEIVAMFKKFPVTWMPALLMELVEAAYEKPVFLSGGASRIVQGVEKKIGKTG